MNPSDWLITMLSRVEDAGINASAPPQQRWLDGRLLRFSPGNIKLKRARCVQAVADGRLPLVVRTTPFSRPEGLDGSLAALGYRMLDDTCVMVATQWPTQTEPLPPDWPGAWASSTPTAGQYRSPDRDAH